MNSKPKLFLLIGVFVLSTIFFFAAINQMLIPSRAAGEKRLSAFIFEPSVQCNPGSTCTISIYASSDQDNGISGITGQIIYSENLNFVSSAGTNGILETELMVRDDAVKHAVKFSYVSLKKDADLKSGGPHKITTLTFKPNVASGTGSLTLATAEAWQAVGTVTFAVFPETKATNVIINDDVIIVSPPVGGGNCGQGDCNCDQKVNMTDFEVMRPGLVNEAVSSCDLDHDGSVDTRDYQIWKGNAFPNNN